MMTQEKRVIYSQSPWSGCDPCRPVTHTSHYPPINGLLTRLHYIQHICNEYSKIINHQSSIINNVVQHLFAVIYNSKVMSSRKQYTCYHSSITRLRKSGPTFFEPLTYSILKQNDCKYILHLISLWFSNLAVFVNVFLEKKTI